MSDIRGDVDIEAAYERVKEIRRIQKELAEAIEVRA